MVKDLGISFGPSLLFKEQVEKGQLKLLLSEYYQPPSEISAHATK